ncbi:MAG: FAD-binding protein [Ruminococcaceae bacterium]|nr:FAD-binding protein [Oscillospiraceae bacterium]
MKSIWNEDVKKPEFNSLNGDVKTDVLIIGGGMSGLLCAHLLKEADIDYILVKADKICSGITNSTTAKLTIQHGLIYDKIKNKYEHSWDCTCHGSRFDENGKLINNPATDDLKN